jgi:hypothetical protein
MKRTPLFWSVFGADVARRAGLRKSDWRFGTGGADAWWDCAVQDAMGTAAEAERAYQRLVDRGEISGDATEAYFQHPRDRIAILSLFRALCLWDNIGDAGNDLETLAKLAGIELPEDEESDTGVDLDALEAMGAMDLRELLQRPQEPRG